MDVEPHRGSRMPGSPAGFSLTGYYLKPVIAAVAVVALVLVLWTLSDLLLLVFAAGLVALILKSLADLISRATGLSRRWAVVLSILAMLVVITGFVALLGTELRNQGVALLERGPELIRWIEETTGMENLDDQVTEGAADAVGTGSLLRTTASFSALAIDVIAGIVLVIVGGVYFAFQPGLYRQGLLLLFPRRVRPEADRTIGLVIGALRLWLLGQLVSMVLVGVLTTLGLWILGVPSALALGFLSALLDFIPVVGPIIAAIPAIAVGFSEGATMALWIAGLYLLVQQIEGNIIYPLIQRKAVDLPPALTIFSIAGFGTLFGVLGIILAAPLTAAAYVAVGRLWVRDVIGEDVKVPGQTSE
jgi:predicted PurR-regulated permease PerM